MALLIMGIRFHFRQPFPPRAVRGRWSRDAVSSNEQDPWNCVTMHQSGVVPHLLRLIGSEDEAVQVS